MSRRSERRGIAAQATGAVLLERRNCSHEERNAGAPGN
jgi:hypothetical protein